MNKTMRKSIVLFIIMITVLSNSIITHAAQWKQDQKGWRYDYEDNGYAKDKWENIDQRWFLFGQDGYLKTGWQEVGGIWYYLEQDGVMSTGWKNINSNWYYFGGNGSMMTSQWMGNYYLSGSGAMAVSTVVDGYSVDSAGKWYTPSTGIEPEYNYQMEVSSGKNTKTVWMQFENLGNEDMVIDGKDTEMINNLDHKYDRKMTLVTKEGGNVSSVTIKPGEVKDVYFKVSSTTWYDSNNTVMIVGFTYKGIYTISFCSLF